MSAYIVEDKTINRIVTGIVDLMNLREGVLSRVKHYTRDLAITSEDEFANELMGMNVDAVRARYPNSEPWHRRMVRYRPERCGPIQLLKSLDCYLYQCSEGEVPERDLFKKMDGIRNGLTRAIVCGSPEYDQSEWG